MITRRDLGKIALASFPVARALAAKPDSKIAGVQIGAQSYSFRDRSLDDAIKAYLDVGLNECELWQGHVEPKGNREEIRKFRLETPMSHFKEIKKKFDDAGIILYAYNQSFRKDYTDAEMDRCFEIAKALGVKYITASSTIDTLEKLKPHAEKAKMVVAMHGHDKKENPNEFATPESFQKAMDMSKYFWVNLDIGHFWAADYDPVDYLEKHHDRIATLHVKDRTRNHGENMPFGKGTTPIKQVLQVLKTKKYKIPANIEYEYKGQDAVEEVKKCYAFMKQCLA